jgi:DNA-binding NarL/FixJ family response regulator
MIKLAIIDDHKIFREGLAQLLNGTGKNNVVYQGGNGLELKNHLESNVPNFELILLDINMPKMNGIDTAYFLSQNYPALKFIALSMYDDDKNIIAMIQNGACGYLPKDTSFDEVIKAIVSVHEEGYYYDARATKALVRSTTQKSDNSLVNDKLTDREITFIRHSCSEMTYKEIADAMSVAYKTVEGYREAVFQKLHVKSRIGLVILAISKGWIEI